MHVYLYAYTHTRQQLHYYYYTMYIVYVYCIVFSGVPICINAPERARHELSKIYNIRLLFDLEIPPIPEDVFVDFLF